MASREEMIIKEQIEQMKEFNNKCIEKAQNNIISNLEGILEAVEKAIRKAENGNFDSIDSLVKNASNTLIQTLSEVSRINEKRAENGAFFTLEYIKDTKN